MNNDSGDSGSDQHQESSDLKLAELFAEYVDRVNAGEKLDYEEVLASVVNRDQIDSSRDVAPLRPADDAIIINSDGLSIEGVLAEILSHLR